MSRQAAPRAIGRRDRYATFSAEFRQALSAPNAPAARPAPPAPAAAAQPPPAAHASSIADRQKARRHRNTNPVPARSSPALLFAQLVAQKNARRHAPTLRIDT